MKKAPAAIAALVLVGTTACGAGGRPSQDELADVFKEGTEDVAGMGRITEESAECMARAFHDSEVSDETLRAIVEKDEDYEPSADDEKALEKTVPEMLRCVPGMEEIREQMENLEDR